MKPTRVLFVCHGNICRSVSAQYMLQHMVDERGLSDRFVIDSAACRSDEIGNPIYPPARRKLMEHGVPIGNHRAVKIAKRDGDEWDLIVGMDVENMRDLKRILGPNPRAQVVKALELLGSNDDIGDPWWTGDFDTVFYELDAVCEEIIAKYGQGNQG